MEDLNKNNFQIVKDYWEKRAEEHRISPEATTKDYYLRVKEINSLSDSIEKLLQSKDINSIADIGCGNGFTLIELAKIYPDISFYGFDYSESMIKFANSMKSDLGLNNVQFKLFDLLSDNFDKKYSLIYTVRCLINLPSWELQKIAIKKIYAGLNIGGTFIMIENFTDGQDNFNNLRKEFGLTEIPVRFHNLFFERNSYEGYISTFFKNWDCENISSLYYIISRIVYSKICSENDLEPDYYDIHHKVGCELPNLGNYGPTCMYTLVKE